MGHDEEHRTVVRSAVKSALQRYLCDAGVRGESGRVTSTDGWTTAIGGGCFLVRPGKRRADCSPIASREAAEADTFPDLEARLDGRAEGNLSDGSSATELPEVNQEVKTDLFRMEERPERGGGGMTVPGEEQGGVVSDTVRMGGEAIVRELDASGVEVEGIDTPPGSTESPAQTSDRDGEPAFLRRDERQSDAAERDANAGHARKTPRSSTVLSALLQDLTRIADSTAESFAEVPVGKAQTRGGEERGFTAVVLLDAPLIPTESPGLPSTNRRPSRASQDAPGTINQLDAALSRGGSGAPSSALATSRDSKHSDKGVDDSEQHPAGLGEPREALEALMSWIAEGNFAAHGQREILLVCGSDSLGRDRNGADFRRNLEISGRRPMPDASGLPCDMDPSTGEGTLDGRVLAEEDQGNGVHDQGLDGTIHADDIEMLLEGKPVKEYGQHDYVASSDLKERKRGDHPAIRQIILGGPVSTAQRQGFTSVNMSPRPPPVRPSELLLQTRPTPIGGVARVTVTFPPSPVVTAASAGLLGGAIGNEAKASSDLGAENVAVEELDCDQREFPRVMVGPVIGRVGPTSAVVLVEVDAVDSVTIPGAVQGATTADAVGVRLTDTLSGREHEMTGGSWTGEPGSGPRVFEFESLTPGRRYAVKLIGVRQRDQVRERWCAWSLLRLSTCAWR